MEKVLLDQILESFGNQDREVGYEIPGNCVFVSKAVQKYDESNFFFLENSCEFGMKRFDNLKNYTWFL